MLADHRRQACYPARDLSRSEPERLREELKEVLELEAQGRMNPTLRLRKKALQHAYDAAIKKKMVRGHRWCYYCCDAPRWCCCCHCRYCS